MVLSVTVMFYGDHVQDTRQLFFSSWYKYRQKETLLPLEQQLVDVILLHPEYQGFLESSNAEQEVSFFPELGQVNPFLHMGFHLAIRDQVTTDRPPGIRHIYQQLIQQYSDVSTVEHMLMEPLSECLWQAQRSRSMPDETAYLSACRQLIL
jgi:hypothetical protein